MQKTWKRIRALVPIILLTMILARLVWIQLRVFSFEVSDRSYYSLLYLESFAGLSCGIDLVSAPQPSSVAGEQAITHAVEIWLASPLYTVASGVACQADLLDESQLIRFNQWIMLAITLMGSLLVRFLTSSWFVSLAVATMLLSRGHIISTLGVAGIDTLMMLTITTWAATLGHFVRTGSLASLAGIVGMGIVASLFTWTAAGIIFALPAVLYAGYIFRRRLAGPLLKRLRSLNQRMRILVQQSGAWPHEEASGFLGRVIGTLRFSLGLDFRTEDQHGWRPDYSRGTLLRTIQMPFALWINHRHRWSKVVIGMSAVGLVSLLFAVIGYAVMIDYASQIPLWSPEFSWHLQLPSGDWFREWARVQWLSLDMHMLLSLLIIAVCAVQSPADGLIGFLEGTWLILFGLCFVLLFSLLGDWLDWVIVASADNLSGAHQLAPRQVIHWFEPVILALGAGGVYNLMKVLDTRAGDRA